MTLALALVLAAKSLWTDAPTSKERPTAPPASIAALVKAAMPAVVEDPPKDDGDHGRGVRFSSIDLAELRLQGGRARGRSDPGDRRPVRE